MDTNTEYITINRALWDKKTEYHTGSDFYKMDAFLNGASSLNDIELQLLGDIRGKSILHLQCHFGQDSLSLARMGARVTGVDLSEAAINKARELNTQLNLNAEFICSNIYDVPGILQQQYDIVFSSYGTIVWLPDMTRWAQVISSALKPGGRFVFADFHPMALMFDDNFTALTYSYFNRGIIEETEAGTYADRDANIHLKSITWNHSFAETMQAILDSGLTLTAHREYDYSPYSCFGNMVEIAPGKYQVKSMEGVIPLVYALEARKP